MHCVFKEKGEKVLKRSMFRVYHACFWYSLIFCALVPKWANGQTVDRGSIERLVHWTCALEVCIQYTRFCWIVIGFVVVL